MAQDSELSLQEYQRRFNSHTLKLKTYMEYVYGLNDWLVQLDVFTDDELDSLKEFKNNPSKINAAMLEILLQQTDSDKYTKFMAALEESLQSHLKRLIHVDGKFGLDDSNQPLNENQRKFLKGNHVELVKIVKDECEGILDRMIAKKCINDCHVSSVREEKCSYDKARELLDIVKNRSLDHFRMFRMSLDKKSQALELTDIDKSGVVQPVDTKQKSSDGDKETAIKPLEETIDEKFDPSNAPTSDESYTLTGVKAKNSIRAYYYCKDLESHRKLRQDVENGIIKESLEKLYNDLLRGTGKTLAVEKVFLVNYRIREFHQQCAMENADVSDVLSDHQLLRNGEKEMKAVFRSVEIRDKKKESILLNAFMWRMAEGRKLYSRPELEAYETLASVCRDWRKMLQVDYFKETVTKSRAELRKKYESIKLKCETRITMDQEITCIGSFMEETYLVIKESPNIFYVYDPNKSAMQSTETTVAIEPTKGEGDTGEVTAEETIIDAALAQTLIGPTTSVEEQIPPTQVVQAQRSKKEVVDVKQGNLEKIDVADGIDISSVVSTDDQTGLFCISRTDNSVWFWTKSETKNKATAFKQFSPCTNITVSPTAKGNLRIVVLKDKNAVEMHNPSSELIQMMFLPNHVKKVNDIICNKEGQMIVSYGSDDNPLHRVTRLNRLGKPIRSYGNERGSGPNELNNPCSISLDQDDEILYVVDKGNERIVALNKNMNVINVVLDAKYGKKEKEIPTAVHYSKGSNRLQVVYKNAMEIFKINRKYRKTPGAVAPPAASPST